MIFFLKISFILTFLFSTSAFAAALEEGYASTVLSRRGRMGRIQSVPISHVDEKGFLTDRAIRAFLVEQGYLQALKVQDPETLVINHQHLSPTSPWGTHIFFVTQKREEKPTEERLLCFVIKQLNSQRSALVEQTNLIQVHGDPAVMETQTIRDRGFPRFVFSEGFYNYDVGLNSFCFSLMHGAKGQELDGLILSFIRARIEGRTCVEKIESDLGSIYGNLGKRLARFHLALMDKNGPLWNPSTLFSDSLEGFEGQCGTVSHGDLLPRNIFVSKKPGKEIQFIDLETMASHLNRRDTINADLAAPINSLLIFSLKEIYETRDFPLTIVFAFLQAYFQEYKDLLPNPERIESFWNRNKKLFLRLPDKHLLDRRFSNILFEWVESFLKEKSPMTAQERWRNLKKFVRRSSGSLAKA
jgi:hypothetical protein